MPTLTWVGKDKVVNHHHDVPFRILNKQYTFAASNDLVINTTQNRLIQGDNLEALKSLLPEFEGKVNCIYIDPPYNTGNEGWVYNDNVNDPKIKKWLGQVVGKEGEDLSRHDKWLCMMYPRLKLLHKLLADDGVIFVSIDDNEQAHLKLLMDEIFGAANFIASMQWQKAYSPRMDAKSVSWDHDQVVVYGNSSQSALNPIEFEQNIKSFTKIDSHTNKNYRRRQWRKEGSGAKKEDRPNLFYMISAPDGTQILPIRPDGSEGRWRGNLAYFQELQTNNEIEWINGNDGWQVYVKQFADENAKRPVSTWWSHEQFGHNHEAAEEIRNLLGVQAFPTPKPTRLIERILQIATNKNAIILDSFAGSGTTAHAVLKLNAQDGGNRRFILCEMMDYAENITAERVRRVINGYGEGTKAVAGLGGGFDYYTIGQPLFLDNDNLNEAVGINAIRDYISYSEGIPQHEQTTSDNPYNPYVLGVNRDVAWVFFYEQEQVTTLDIEFLGTLQFGQNKPNSVIIYADKCLLSPEFMRKHNIRFKKIPRDITRF